MEESMDKDLLGICIPTFNRSSYLRILLDSLVPQANKYGVIIYISDNCSSDTTKETVYEFQKNYSNVVYDRNTTNIGFYRNLIKVLKMASTKYIWMLGDDDVIRDGAVELIIGSLRSNPDFVILNSSDCNRDMSIKLPKIIDCDKNIYYNKGDHYKVLFDLRKYSYFGIMASMIIKKSIITDKFNLIEDPSFELFGNSYLPLLLFYRSIINKSGIFLCEPVILRRPNMRSVGDSPFEWYIGDRMRALQWLTQYGYPAYIVKQCLDHSFSAALFNAVLVKAEDPRRKVFEESLKKTRLVPNYEKLIYLILDNVPTYILKIMRQIMYKLSGV